MGSCWRAAAASPTPTTASDERTISRPERAARCWRVVALRTNLYEQLLSVKGKGTEVHGRVVGRVHAAPLKHGVAGGVEAQAIANDSILRQPLEIAERDVGRPHVCGKKAKVKEKAAARSTVGQNVNKSDGSVNCSRSVTEATATTSRLCPNQILFGPRHRPQPAST